jgi:hypothetical protein
VSATTEERFVYDSTEVRLTGRTATRDGASKQVLVEIEPVHAYDGTWRKWVPRKVLFRIDPQTS